MSTSPLFKVACKLASREDSEIVPRPAYSTKTCPRCKGKGFIPHYVHVVDGRCARQDCDDGQVPAGSDAVKAYKGWRFAQRLSGVATRGKRLTAALLMTEGAPDLSRRESRWRREWQGRRDGLRKEWRDISEQASQL